MGIKFTDLHLHTEYSLQDGMIRVADYKDPKHIKSDIVLNAERRNTEYITATDHGNMYCQASLAQVCKTFGFKHIPACEFYLAPTSRFDKLAQDSKRSDAYDHINGWAMNKKGYTNMCIMQKASYSEGFYYVPRIDKELIEKHHDGIIWSDACVGGTVCSHILKGNIDKAYSEFMWYLDLLKDDFFIEWHSHNLKIEDECNAIKKEWADKHGVPIVACTDAHYYKKEDTDAHKALLCIQYGNWFDNPARDGFQGDGYWLLSEEELVERYPIEYLNNTSIITSKCEGNCITFGDVIPPQFKIPQSFIDKIGG